MANLSPISLLKSRSPVSGGTGRGSWEILNFWTGPRAVLTRVAIIGTDEMEGAGKFKILTR